MCQKFTPDELNRMDHQSKNDIICQMQDRLDKLEHDYENLIEQIRPANQQKFGRSTEKLNETAGQLSFFNEAEAFCDETAECYDKRKRRCPLWQDLKYIRST